MSNRFTYGLSPAPDEWWECEPPIPNIPTNHYDLVQERLRRIRGQKDFVFDFEFAKNDYLRIDNSHKPTLPIEVPHRKKQNESRLVKIIYPDRKPVRNNELGQPKNEYVAVIKVRDSSIGIKSNLVSPSSKQNAASFKPSPEKQPTLPSIHDIVKSRPKKSASITSSKLSSRTAESGGPQSQYIPSIPILDSSTAQRKDGHDRIEAKSSSRKTITKFPKSITNSGKEHQGLSDQPPQALEDSNIEETIYQVINTARSDRSVDNRPTRSSQAVSSKRKRSTDETRDIKNVSADSGKRPKLSAHEVASEGIKCTDTISGKLLTQSEVPTRPDKINPFAHQPDPINDTRSEFLLQQFSSCAEDHMDTDDISIPIPLPVAKSTSSFRPVTSATADSCNSVNKSIYSAPKPRVKMSLSKNLPVDDNNKMSSTLASRPSIAKPASSADIRDPPIHQKTRKSAVGQVSVQKYKLAKNSLPSDFHPNSSTSSHKKRLYPVDNILQEPQVQDRYKMSMKDLKKLLLKRDSEYFEDEILNELVTTRKSEDRGNSCMETEQTESRSRTTPEKNRLTEKEGNAANNHKNVYMAEERDPETSGSHHLYKKIAMPEAPTVAETISDERSNVGSSTNDRRTETDDSRTVEELKLKTHNISVENPASSRKSPSDQQAEVPSPSTCIPISRSREQSPSNLPSVGHLAETANTGITDQTQLNSKVIPEKNVESTSAPSIPVAVDVGLIHHKATFETDGCKDLSRPVTAANSVLDTPHPPTSPDSELKCNGELMTLPSGVWEAENAGLNNSTLATTVQNSQPFTSILSVDPKSKSHGISPNSRISSISSQSQPSLYSSQSAQSPSGPDSEKNATPSEYQPIKTAHKPFLSSTSPFKSTKSPKAIECEKPITSSPKFSSLFHLNHSPPKSNSPSKSKSIFTLSPSKSPSKVANSKLSFMSPPRTSRRHNITDNSPSKSVNELTKFLETEIDLFSGVKTVEMEEAEQELLRQKAEAVEKARAKRLLMSQKTADEEDEGWSDDGDVDLDLEDLDLSVFGSDDD
ncbi:hypothetical protein BKA69DRAFT_1174789 [Paraphysoderma sedebokerense]|nr:hypothetical protein BKA69DRAFT_1174789 [Paraphysoderma sedebokerense]